MHICLLDIDGTLVLTGGAGQTAFAETLAADFGISEVLAKVSFAGRSDRAIVAELFRAHGVEATEANWKKFCIGYLERLETALAKHRGQVLPGVSGLLRTLSARGDIALGLLTGNVREGARKKLAHYGLWDWFAFGGFGDDYEERNDIAAAALAAAHQHLNGTTTTPGEVIVVGDTLNDITCGRSIGARCVAVATGHASADELRDGQPDVLIRTLEDPTPILSLLPR